MTFLKRFQFETILIAILFLLLTSCSQSSSQNKISYVLDKENVLTNFQIDSLNKLFAGHEKKTTNQIVVMTTPDFYPDSTIEDFSLHTFRSLQIGQKEKNNGTLIVFSQAKRQVRIATGYGTENVLQDSTAKRIIDKTMIPYFKQQKYFDGLWQGSKTIVEYLERPENIIK